MGLWYGAPLATPGEPEPHALAGTVSEGGGTMDLSKLSMNERNAAYGAIVVVIAGIVSNWGGLMWLAVLLAVGVLVVLFLPQLSPGTSLPGSRGSLLVVGGVVAAACALIEILRFISYFTRTLDDWQTWAFVIALVGSLVMAYAGWRAFQAEGGKLVLGASGGTAPGSASAPPVETAAPTSAPAAPAAPSAPPAASQPSVTPEVSADRDEPPI